MIRTIIKSNTYKDSVELMLLTSNVSSLEGVKHVSIMMATSANKDILKQSGLLTEEVENASADDMAIVFDVDTDELASEVIDVIKKSLTQNNSVEQTSIKSVRNWDDAISQNPDANLAVFSIPGIYAAQEAHQALDLGLNVFMFSDNVTLEDEVALKQKAHEKGLLVMGPDCGTGILSGVPIAFTNKVSNGTIGVVGASGTGIQEVTSIIDNLGSGISSAVGTGGRDLYEAVDGITMLDSLKVLNSMDNTKVIVIISKPPHPKVKEKIEDYIRSIDKPVVTVFIGNKPTHHENGVYNAYTLEEAAYAAVAFDNGGDPFTFNLNRPLVQKNNDLTDKVIKGYYSGGTLASETAMLLKEGMNIKDDSHSTEGYVLNYNGFEVIDLGDDFYTQGRPHPMIDPNARVEVMRKALDDSRTGIIMFDVVLGYGSHENMAQSIVNVVKELKEKANKENRTVLFVATVCGTALDFQDIDLQKKILREEGVIVAESNAHAALISLQLLGYNVLYQRNDIISSEKKISNVDKYVPETTLELFSRKPEIINVGLKSFASNLEKEGIKPVHFDWRPIAGGNKELINALRYLKNYDLSKGGK